MLDEVADLTNAIIHDKPEEAYPFVQSIISEEIFPEKFEIFHGVKIQDSAIIAAATLSNRYITNRFLPDKAIDLIDESCASIRMQLESNPTEIDELNRKILQLEIEKVALSKEKDSLSKDRLDKINKELNMLKDKNNLLKQKWEKEKSERNKINDLKKKLEKAKFELDKYLQEFL